MANRFRILTAVGGVALLAFGLAGCVSPGGAEEVDEPDVGEPAAVVDAAEITPPAPPGVDIWTAAGEGDLDALMAHKRAGTNLDEWQIDVGVTPLLVAVISGQQEATEWLIANGADPRAEMRDGGNALHAAAFVGNADAAELLLAHDVDPEALDSQGSTTWDILALDWPTTEYISGMLSLDLEQAGVEAGRAAIRAMLAPGGAPDLMAAIAAGDAAAVQSQLEDGADPNHAGDDGSPIILVAASAGHAEIVSALILAGANIDQPHWQNGATALHAAAFFGRAEVAKVLIEHGADGDAMTNDGATVMQILDVDWATTAYLAEVMGIPVDEESVMQGRDAVRALLAE